MNEQANKLGDPAHDPGCRRLIRVPANWSVSAEFDGPQNCYRYTLTHRWREGPMVLFAMTNPSGADLRFGDMTVMKTARIANRLGFGGQFIANACSYRATDKMRLLTVGDPVGPGNHAAILEMANQAGMVVVAHGRLPGNLQCHAEAMCKLLLANGYALHVLRLTSDDVPMHPLARGKAHIPEDTTPQLWKSS